MLMLDRIRAIFADAQAEGLISCMTSSMRRVILHRIQIFRPATSL